MTQKMRLGIAGLAGLLAALAAALLLAAQTPNAPRAKAQITLAATVFKSP